MASATNEAWNGWRLCNSSETHSGWGVEVKPACGRRAASLGPGHSPLYPSACHTQSWACPRGPFEILHLRPAHSSRLKRSTVLVVGVCVRNQK